MRCYVCAQEGGISESVAICVACGAALCMEHAIREEPELWEGDYPFPARVLKRRLPRFLCPECSAAFREGR
ncbi:MAG: DUF2180 family protein [Methanomicrobiaceae archaeon]|uniref:Zinc finger protein n=1 Tax=hydrocarbon metagenome TaxID=938273 RepID=A0A0W8FDE9_9ZZZZ|nr:DUF2180 family protein [Methanomicrobiaceae archaeon]MDD5418396.1 DUF2180 family protein [Methanomicrobiaceae archaeon]